MATGSNDIPDFDGFVDQVSEIIAAGEGDGRDMAGLKQMRQALRKVGRQIEQAEERGYARAQAETQSRGVLAAKGIPEIAASYFSEIDLSDTAAVDAKIAQLKQAGLTFGQATPSGPSSSADAPQATPAQAQPPATPTGGLDPAALRQSLANLQITGATAETVIAAAVGQMAAAQAGGTPPGTTGDLESRIQQAAANPASLDQDARYQLAEQLNRELDGLSAAAAGQPLLG